MPTSTIEQLLETLEELKTAKAALDKEGLYLSEAGSARTSAFTAAWTAHGYDRAGFVACRDGQVLEFVRVEGDYSLNLTTLLTPPLTDDEWEALPEDLRQLKTVAEGYLRTEERVDVAEADYEEAEAALEAVKARLRPLMEAIGEGQYLCGNQVLSISQSYGEYAGKLIAIL